MLHLTFLFVVPTLKTTFSQSLIVFQIGCHPSDISSSATLPWPQRVARSVHKFEVSRDETRKEQQLIGDISILIITLSTF